MQLGPPHDCEIEIGLHIHQPAPAPLMEWEQLFTQLLTTSWCESTAALPVASSMIDPGVVLRCPCVRVGAAT